MARAADKLLDDPVQLAALLDQHGTGRVGFATHALPSRGFRRVAKIHRLNPPPDDEELFDALSEEFADDTDFIAASVR